MVKTVNVSAGESPSGATSSTEDAGSSPFMTQEGWDFTNPDLLEQGIPVQEFAALRSTAPVWWNAQREGKGGGFHDGGYWVISKHAHIREISKNNADWSTASKGVIMRFDDEMTQEQLDVTKALLINHDPPDHTRLRKLVSKAFTPRAVQALEDKLDDAARTIVRHAAEQGTGDFVHDVAVDLPLLAIADLLGVPEDDRVKLFTWSNNMMNYDDPEFGEDPQMASAEILGYGYNMAEARRKNPVDDIVSVLVNADIEGQSLDEAEFGFFFILLTVAGNETTRNAISHGMNAFLEHPDQWSCSSGSGRPPRSTRSSAGPRRSTASSAPPSATRRSAASTSPRASASGCSTVRRTTTTRSSRSPTSSTSCEIPTRTSVSAATVRTSASVRTWHGWRST